MQIEKLTIKSQEALAEAQSQASSRGHARIQPAHLLRALLAQPEGSTVPVLQKLGVSLDLLLGQVERLLEATPRVSGGAQAQLDPALSRILEAALEEATTLRDEYVSTEHLLLALAADGRDARLAASRRRGGGTQGSP